jgi:catechol 2,3-dioxygenase-like lactoylglutathione lyase family enzyme
MSTITDVTGVSVPVVSQDEGLAFFTNKLGFEIRRDARMGDAFRWVTVAAPGAAVEVALQDDPDHAGHETGIRFTTSNAQAEHERLAQEGVSVDELLRWPGVPPMFKFNDPDGNTYTIIEAL